MSEERIRAHARARGFHPRTVSRWLAWGEADRVALLELASALRIGENHLRDLMDWLEEIALRDGVSIAAVLAEPPVRDIATDPRLGRPDKLKKIKEEIRRRRFPRLSRIEDAIQSSIRDLKLHPAVKLSVAPGLEGGDLRIEFRARSAEEFLAAVARLGEAGGLKPLRDVFALLSGEREPE